MKLRVVYIWSNRGRTVSFSQKLVVLPKIPQSQDSQTTFKTNLTSIFLSAGANLKYPLYHEGPCTFGHCPALPVLVKVPTRDVTSQGENRVDNFSKVNFNFLS